MMIAATFVIVGLGAAVASAELVLGCLVCAAALGIAGIRNRRKGLLQQAADRFRSARLAAVVGGGVLVFVSLINVIPLIFRTVLSSDSQTSLAIHTMTGAIDTTVTAVSLAVVAVCAVLVAGRSVQH